MSDVREWRDGDQAAVDALLDITPDPLWATQGHRLHGPPRDGERWRRTWLAERGGEVIGAVTLGVNRVHSDRYSLAVEVAPDARRHGIGTALVDHARQRRPEPLPMSAKVRERDPAALALARSQLAQVYLRAPCPLVVGDDPGVADWCSRHSAVETAPLSSVPSADRAALFAELYRWVHADRAPVRNEAALAEVARMSVAEADPNLSSVYWDGDRVTAVAFVFAGAGRHECVTETVRAEQPDAVTQLAATLARTLTRLGDLGASVGLDGHDTDRHLPSVLADLPVAATDPLLLVTLDAPRGAGVTLQ